MTDNDADEIILDMVQELIDQIGEYYRIRPAPIEGGWQIDIIRAVKEH